MFDYQKIPVTHRDRLQEIAAEAFESRPSSAVEMVRVGGLLDEASKIIPYGHFLPWLQLECAWSISLAYQFINAFRKFSHLQISTLSKFELSAIRAFSHRNIGKIDTQRAIHLAEQGHRITWTESQKILGRWADKAKDPTKAEPKRESLQKVAESWDTITITRDEDSENGLVIYTVLAINVTTGARRSSAHTDLKIALQAVAGEEPTKECGSCRKMLVIGSFSVDRVSPDGRGSRCKVCERKRVKEYEKTQKRKAAERETTPV